MRLQINALLLIFFATCSYSLLYGQTTINCDEFFLTQQLTQEDFVIGPGVTQIVFYLEGGQGGDAILDGTFCDTHVRGGRGSQVEMTFPVTDDITQANSLKTGGIIRIYVGQPGQNEERGCTPSPAGVFGGGGGATAVLYRDDLLAEGYWLVLGIAGGGGGGSRPVAGVFRSGQGGQASINGGNSGESNGGVQGDCGESTNNAHAGGGVSCENSNATAEGRNIIGDLTGSIIFRDLKVSLDTQIPVTSTGGVKNNHANGGNGFVGGSVGQTAGGGGGGASGGASANTYGGGGGGTYVTLLRNAQDINITNGSDGQGGINYVAMDTQVSISDAVCPSSVVLNLDEDGEAVVDAELLFEVPSSIPCDATATLFYIDNDFPFPLDMETIDYTFSCPETPGQVGSLQYIIFDSDGTVASQCSTPVSLLDNIDPVAHCKNVTLVLNEAGTVSLPPAAMNNGSTDNCAVTNFQVSRSAFDCTDIGNHTVTLTAFDAAGNTSQCTATVMVRDQTPPVAICSPTPVDLVLDPNVYLTELDLSTLDGGSTDNCDNGNLTYFGPSIAFSCFNIGTSYEIVLQVRDQSGNASAPCIGIVTVVDGTPPVARCVNSVNLSLDDLGQAILDPIQLNDGSTDECSNALQYSASQTIFECGDLGENTVTLTAFDASGNASQCNATVTVNDQTAPVASCKPSVDIALDDNGNLTLTERSILDDGSSDNCDSDNLMYIGPSMAFSCADVGTSSEITMQVVDLSGNVSQPCVSTVNIVDGSPPMARCKAVLYRYFNMDGEFTLNPMALNDGSNDACSGTNLQFSASQTSFDCSNSGSNQVTLQVQDDAGNTATCSTILVLVSREFPQIDCTDLDVTLDLDGTASISPTDLILSERSSCFPIVERTLSQSDFNTSHIGPNPVTVTVENTQGYTSSCNVTVHVMANPLPVEWVSFSGQVVSPKEVQIEWSTSSETDNHYFDLQHSSDGRIFTTIGRVFSNASTSTTTNAYEYIHDRPLNGWNYYRLQQVDYSGSSSYSNTISVRIESNDAPDFSIAPNPGRDQTQLSFTPFSKPSELMVRNSNGRVVGHYAIPPGESSFHLDTSTWPAGVYFLCLKQGAQNSIKRLVKVD